VPPKSNAKRKDDLISVQVYLGRVDGKRKYKTFYGKTQKEANKKAEVFKQKLGMGVDVFSERTPFGTYRARWLERKKASVSPSTYPSYEYHANALSQLDMMPIAKVQAQHIQAIVDELAARNPTTRRPSSKKTLNNIKKAAVQILEIARREHAIIYNNAEGVEVSRQAPKSTRRAISKDEMAHVEDTPHRAQLAAMIMMYAGLRRGEVSALYWRDVDLSAARITVHRSVEFVHGEASLKEGTKTAAGNRVVYIPRKLVEFLREQPQHDDLLVQRSGGGVMNNSSWYALWRSYMFVLGQKYGAKHHQFGAHDLRHTFATTLYHAGIDILTARDQLGHADIQTTMGIYTHLDSQFKERKMQKLDEYLST